MCLSSSYRQSFHLFILLLWWRYGHTVISFPPTAKLYTCCQCGALAIEKFTKQFHRVSGIVLDLLSAQILLHYTSDKERSHPKLLTIHMLIEACMCIPVHCIRDCFPMLNEWFLRLDRVAAMELIQISQYTLTWTICLHMGLLAPLQIHLYL